MPRILLVIDEFQVLFGADDALGRQASARLDALLRRGRGFGLQVVLATQALSAGWSLSSSVLGQISLRVALSCDERVSRQILGDDNPAARGLDRPGDAIFNDKNGRPEGNARFQVADLQKDMVAGRVELIRSHYGEPAPDRVIFDGRVMPDPSAHGGLFEPMAESRLVLGQAMAIGARAIAELEERQFSHLIVFASDRLMRRRLMRTLLAGAGGMKRVLVDGAPRKQGIRESFTGEIWTAPADFPAALKEHHEEMMERIAGRGDGSPRLLVIHGAQHIEALRQDVYAKAVGPGDVEPLGKLFEGLLRKGGAQGIHILIVEDSLASFGHAIDPQHRSLECFDFRASMGLSDDESKRLFGCSDAARIEEGRGLLVQRSTNRKCPFRVFDWPEDRE